jgi:hypothetical protein
MFVAKFLRSSCDFGIDHVLKYLSGHEFDHSNQQHILCAIQVQRLIIERVIDCLNSTTDPYEVFQVTQLL